MLKCVENIRNHTLLVYLLILIIKNEVYLGPLISP